MNEPTLKEIADYLSSAAHRGSRDDIKVFETDTNEPEGEFVMLFAFGYRDFSCRVTVTELEEM